MSDFARRSPVQPVDDEVTPGLSPRNAECWLRLHRVFALRPEEVTPHLEAGATPEQILAKAEASGGVVEGLPSQALRSSTKAARDRARLEKLGARVVPRPDPAYPERLKALVDAPCVLLVRGDVASLRMNGVAIVGARAATEPARRMARRLAHDLAAGGLTIISGLARGIDAEAHRGALEAGGRTVAVLACGLDQVYPPEHRELAQEICERGAVVSEMPIAAPPRRAHFPLRNRLISGLSIGVIVVEARRRSGSLITVRHALNQGREVFVVPGAVAGPFAEGTNSLLREGARPILDARDVFEDLGLEARPLDAVAGSGASGIAVGQSRIGSDSTTELGFARRLEAPEHDSVEARILSILGEGPVSREALATRLSIEPGVLAHALLELELTNRLIEDRDGRLQRNWS